MTTDADAILLARYLDDDLSAEETTAFEARLAAEPALKAELELQRRIDASLQARFADAPDAAAVLERAQGAKPAGKLLKPAFGVLLVVAAAVILIAALPLLKAPDPTPTAPTTPAYRTGPPRPLHVHYADRLKAWKPDWVCKTEEEFLQTFAKRLGQAVALKASKQVKALGLAYVNGLSQDTIALLAEADGRKIMVFVDKAAKDRKLKLPKDSKLHLHRRELGSLVLYEVSPAPKPAVLELFEAR